MMTNDKHVPKHHLNFPKRMKLSQHYNLWESIVDKSLKMDATTASDQGSITVKKKKI